MNIYLVTPVNTRYFPSIDNGQSKRLGDTGINATLRRSRVNEGVELSW